MSEAAERDAARVFLAVPFYQAFPGECVGNHDAPCVPPDQCLVYRHGEPFVDRNFSNCWATALNTRAEHDWTAFGMVHVDVQPSPHRGWLSVLEAERRRCGADLLSVVLPIKTRGGVTSTAVLAPDGRWRRLTMREVWGFDAVTFDAETAGFAGCKLLASTGLWVCDFTKPWAEEVWFETHCRIARDREGRFEVQSFPEDWHFSRMLHERGLKVMATKILACDHWGISPFPNHHAWGSTPSDRWHDDCPWLLRPTR